MLPKYPEVQLCLWMCAGAPFRSVKFQKAGRGTHRRASKS